jgi:hypothetical protein
MADRWGDDGFEVGEYIASFKSSSTRVRWVIFIIATVSIMIFTATWNGVGWSWAKQRERKWAQEQIDAARLLIASPSSEAVARAEARALLERDRRATTPEQRARLLDEVVGKKVRADYVGSVAGEYLLLDVPGVPAATDVNELGLLAGLTLTLLMLLLLFSLIRQHENLYLCCFKIRRLFERDGEVEDGESRANFLYHALAMGEVLGAPPTLARWHQRPSRVNRNILAKALFFVPVAVQGFVVWTNVMTRGVAISHFGELPLRFWVQFVFALSVLGLSMPCFLYLRACHKRWSGIFYYVNPSKRTAPVPMGWWRWVKVRSGWSREEKALRRALEAELLRSRDVEQVEGSEEAATRTRDSIPLDWLARGSVEAASILLMKSGRSAARRRCKESGTRYLRLTSQAMRSSVKGTELEVDIEWRFLQG